MSMACIDSTVISPFVTLFVGLAAAFIGFQQWRLAQRKLKYDLFDRRYKVYDATRKFLVSVLREAEAKDEFVREFIIGTSDAEFLYPKDLVEYLDSLREHAFLMRKHQRARDNLPVSDVRNKYIDLEHDELNWLESELTTLRQKFHPFLGFSSIK